MDPRGRVALWHSVLPTRAVVALLCTLWACGSGPEEVVILVPENSHGQIVRVINAELAEAPGRPRIRVEVVDRQLSDRLAIMRWADTSVRRPEVMAVVGHSDSRTALAAAPIYDRAGVVHVVPSGTSRLLAQAGPWTFVLVPDELREAEFMGEHLARDHGVRSVTIVFENDDYGQGLRAALHETLPRFDIRIVDEVFHGAATCPGANPFDVLIGASLRRAQPDAFVLATRDQQSICIARVLREQAPHTRVLLADGSDLSLGYWSPLRPWADSVEAVSFWTPPGSDSASRAMVARYQEVLARPDLLPGVGAVLTYDAIHVVVRAIRDVGPSRIRVRDYLASLGRTRPPVEGVTGSVAFPADAQRRFHLRAGGPWFDLQEAGRRRAAP